MKINSTWMYVHGFLKVKKMGEKKTFLVYAKG